MHPEATALHSLATPTYTSVAVALDFSENDQKLLAHALGQGNNSTKFILLHIVESVPARIYEFESDDLETEKDKEHLQFYAQQLRDRGFDVEAKVGFGSRSKEIVRLVKESGADMLVIGAHGHSGIKDFFYGETINSVRHELKIPVLVVNL
jgi:manganese transport protein